MHGNDFIDKRNNFHTETPTQIFYGIDTIPSLQYLYLIGYL